LEVETDHNFYANGILVHNCHHVEQEEYATLAARCPAKWWLGLTGTPMRPDGSGLGKNNWDYIVTGPSFRQLQDMGFLVPLRVFADKALGQRRKSGEKTGVIGDPVGHWRRNAEGRPTLGFTRSVSEARFLADQFDKDGIPSAVLNAESSFEERTEVLGKLADGKLLWVGNAFLLGEGVDIPQLGCIQLLRKCGGLRDYIQLVSRVVRSCPAIGKTDGILLDHSGAALDHRYPEIELEWHLDESAEAFRKRIKEQKEKELAPAVTCNSCGCVFAGRPTCPHCGTPLPPSRKRSKPIIERGLLTEIGCNAGAERKSQLQKTWETVLAMAKAKNWSVKKTNVIFNNYTGMYPEKANVHPLFRREDRELTVVEVLCPPTSAN
jgi:superfamily II DNA or RNA helicase